MSKKASHIPKWLYWTPRVLAILMLLFMTLFSLDVFDERLGFWGTLLGLFMHNLPVIVLAIVLWASWKKREIIAAVAFIFIGLFFLSRYIMTAVINGFEWYYLSWSLMIVAPLFAIGALFLVNWLRKRKDKREK